MSLLLTQLGGASPAAPFLQMLQGVRDSLDPGTFSYGPQMYGAPAPGPQPLLPGLLQGLRDPLDPGSYSAGPELLVPGASPAAAAVLLVYRPLEGYRDPLDPGTFSYGPQLYPGATPPAAAGTTLIPGMPLGTQQMIAAATALAGLPGDKLHGSRLLVNTRGGGVDAWAWQDG